MQDQGPWDDCPSGVVTGMAARLRRRKRQAQRRPFIFLGVAALLLSAIGYVLTSRDGAGSGGALNCRETVPLLASYHDRSLDAASANRVREHLSRCPKCREHYEELYPSEVRNRSSADSTMAALSQKKRGIIVGSRTRQSLKEAAVQAFVW